MQFPFSLVLAALLPDGLALAADVQRVANRDHDMDRGPAAFHASGLHWES